LFRPSIAARQAVECWCHGSEILLTVIAKHIGILLRIWNHGMYVWSARVPKTKMGKVIYKISRTILRSFRI